MFTACTTTHSDVCQANAELNIAVWDRAGSAGNEFLGTFKIRPTRIPNKVNDTWFKLIPKDWKERTKGEIHLALCYRLVDAKPVTIDDFDLLKVLGKGSFGKVMQVRKKDTGRIYAMKILVKDTLVARDEVQHTKAERHVLAQCDNPFLVSLKYCFQTPEKIYMVLDYVHGGELFLHLQKVTTFSDERAKFYTAELVVALEHLHAHNIIYRDLKPENVLLDYSGHIVLTDFGLCKENMEYDTQTKTFCGTAEYLAPEVLKGQGYSRSVDWWSLGVLLYEMLTGLPPFYSENTNLMYKKILYSDINFPPNAVSEVGQDILRGFLKRNPEERLGAGPDDAVPIKAHPFFAEIDFDMLVSKKLLPPFKPHLKNLEDVSNFDPEFTVETPKDSFVDPTTLSSTLQNEFRGFSYVDYDENALHQASRP
ncbi:AGC/AKT protein kinase, variant [Capsaspora owczarzaki ATCC 30864]|uniref:non-specific serine/threonine protein kinase n=1 Tax=Capsaspora owczarzaki (strain ATCC 30864) TaxID=595528 RepID=A0A0D2WTW7_CAPO3|nr:AGC/AKT protein kinase, variant [Capsaspora owczarzaki ATCC 30864]